MTPWPPPFARRASPPLDPGAGEEAPDSQAYGLRFKFCMMTSTRKTQKEHTPEAEREKSERGGGKWGGGVLRVAPAQAALVKSTICIGHKAIERHGAA